MDGSNVSLELENVTLVLDTELFILGIYISNLGLDFIFFLDAGDDFVEVSLEILNFLIDVLS
jgi:hypothetical protein